MGVPKFFRYISERYPCLSEIVKEHQIPQFDNLYLDMNGIIHTCSHPEDDDPHFRITEEKIFLDIFHYIEVLFRMIKPRKLFFMAVDGVAPRAKMNQQRARRFRSAKEAEKLEEKAKKKGEVLPTEARFDSNCITPGTEFMERLHEQLKYFIVNKISTDKLWRQCKIILSGHETPGEGEHKIMDYIRYMRAQPDHNPNTRHCLYGLDADLIMLGLCTHEPHFSLLREEVKFGRKSTKRKSSPEEITFFLLHLSLMREYLEMEFADLEKQKQLSFPYDIEKIIDDWVLMGFLVGNDFIPNLPNLHIANGALPILYQTYVKVMPTFDGYINEAGTLNLARFEKFMQALSTIDHDNFQEQYADIKYFEMKTGRRPNETQRKSYKLEESKSEGNGEEDLIQFDNLETEKPKNDDLAALIQATNDELFPKEKDDTNEVDEEDECSDFEDDDDDDSDKLFQEEFTLHKKDYYINKLDYKNFTPEVLRLQAEGYVRAIQWNLNYYYNGVCSWSWFYPHHYAPYISDITGFSDLAIEFELEKPFFPYEQLLAVLPAASKNLLPEAYRHLMTEEDSLIKMYYPEEFETDLNGKKNDWEAVVLIPFIDEKILLEAMSECNERLTDAEFQRNRHGPMLIYRYTPTFQEKYEAPQYFSPVVSNYAVWSELTIDDIRVPREKLVKGAYPGVKLDIYFPGFPTTKHLEYTHRLEKAHVKVHEYPSRNENMIITIKKKSSTPALDIIARELLGNTVYVAWPHLIEARVVTVSSKEFQYHSTGEPGQYNVVENKGNIQQHWDISMSGTVEQYRNRFGIEVGETEILVHVNVLIGRRYMFTRQGRVTLEKQWAPIKQAYPLQVVVKDITTHDENYSTFRDLESVFPIGSNCFMLGHPYYGCMGEVKDSKEAIKNGRIKVSMQCIDEPNFESIKDFQRSVRVRYMNSYEASTKLAISKQLFTRVTGSILVSVSSRFHTTEDTNKVNIGLNLKFSKRNEEIPGYTKRENNNLWLYSDKAVQLVKGYNEFCPTIFNHLNCHNENVYYVEDLFPEDNGREKLAEIVAWIKAQPYYTIERQPCGTQALEPEVVKKIEEIIDSSKTNDSMKEISMKVKPHLLFKSDLSMGNVVPDPSSKYQLYDRVVNVRECYTVPVGLRGTVIALHKSEVENEDAVSYDVVFDKEFTGGLSLNCAANRGYRLPKSALINISHGQRELEQKSGRPGELTQKVRTSMRQHVETPPRMYSQQHSAFVACPPGNPGPPMYLQHNPYLYQNSYNNAYVPPTPVQGQQFSQPRKIQHPLPATIGQTRHFMPYNDKLKNNSNQHTSKSQYTTPSNKQDNRQPSVDKKSDQRQAPKVDTNYLMKVLKITKDQDSKPKIEETEDQTQLKVEDIFTHAKNKPLAPIQPKHSETNTSNSVKLLSYYQSNGLGCPHYSYFELPDKTVQAQLINPLNGNVVCGIPSANKVEACENAAAEILAMIERGPPTQPSVIPQPPKDWCQQQSKTPVTKQNDTTSNSKSKMSALATPFVPLQAVKSHIIRNASTPKSNYVRQNSDGSAKVKSENGTNQHETPSAESGSTFNKPFRKRKMRIAANFPTKFEE